MKKIFIILICLLIASPSLAGTTPLFSLWPYFKHGKLVKIPSYNSKPFPNEFMSLKDGSYKNSPVKIDALMVFPKKGEGPFPTLVFNHASGGSFLFGNEWFKLNRQVAKQLNKKGMAVMFVDNFTGRHVVSADEDQSQVSTYSFYIDAFMTLEYLSKDPRVNIKKVGITGWSRGGMNSLAIAETRIRDALISKDLYFAASLPRSVECRQSGFFRNPQPIKETKILMVNGKIDDASHAHICEEYGEKMKAAGADIKVVTKHGWGHGFDANYSAEFEAGQEVWHNCPDYYTEDDGMANKDAKFDDSCITHEGYHIGGTRKTGQPSWTAFRGTALKFFKKNLLK
jgi:dienelactone hydrolase